MLPSRRIVASWVLAAAIVAVASSARVVLASDADAANGAAANDATAREGSAGMRVYVDPATGALTSEPAVPEPQPRSAGIAATSTSTQGLVEQAAPGGGVMVDLQGRFQNEMRATIGPDGAMHTDCVGTPPAAER
jgi:hypothetical protein